MGPVGSTRPVPLSRAGHRDPTSPRWAGDSSGTFLGVTGCIFKHTLLRTRNRADLNDSHCPPDRVLEHVSSCEECGLVSVLQRRSYGDLQAETVSLPVQLRQVFRNQKTSKLRQTGECLQRFVVYACLDYHRCVVDVRLPDVGTVCSRVSVCAVYSAQMTDLSRACRRTDNLAEQRETRT